MTPVDRARALVHDPRLRACVPMAEFRGLGTPAITFSVNGDHSEYCDRLTAAIAPLVEALEAVNTHLRRGIVGRMSRHATTCTCALCVVVTRALATLDKGTL